MKYPRSIQNLIDLLTKLPTVGPKTAERYVFYFLNQSSEELQKFAQAIAELKEKTTVCSSCHAVMDASPCSICADQKRSENIICVVGSTRDMLSIETTKEYNGKYHILGGVINTIEGIKPETLNIKTLLNKIKKSQIKEVILALNPTLEGETTVMYLTKALKPFKIKISRLAKGLPTGANLEYADEITLGNALKYRNQL